MIRMDVGDWNSQRPGLVNLDELYFKITQPELAQTKWVKSENCYFFLGPKGCKSCSRTLLWTGMRFKLRHMIHLKLSMPIV